MLYGMFYVDRKFVSCLILLYICYVFILCIYLSHFMYTGAIDTYLFKGNLT